MTNNTRSLDDMPEDVWIDIIKTYITNYDDQYPYMVIDKLLPLLLVSRNWDIKIRSIPTLWSDIVMGDEIDDLEMKVSICLHFSQNALIGLYLVGYTNTWSLLSPRVILERSRISSIIFAEVDEHHTWAGNITSILTELFPLTALRRLRCPPNSRHRLDPEQFELCPVLSDIEGCFIPSMALDQTPQTLQTFCADEAPKNFIPFFGRFDSLKSVSFFWPDSDAKYSTTIDDGQLYWRSLTCWWDENRSHIGLLSRLRSSLVNLTISLHFDEWLIEFLRSLGELSQLRDCELDLRSSVSLEKPVAMASDNIITSSCPATRLKFHISVRLRREELETVFSTLQASLPMIKELDISANTCEQALYLLSGRGFPRIATLSIASGSSYTPELNSTQLAIQALSSLTSICTNNFSMEILSPFMTLGVEKVHYTGMLELKVSDFNKWEGLHTLKLSVAATQVQWHEFSSHSLRKLICDGGGDSTFLFHHLATHPLSFPSLEYLEVHTIPDWDIFFITLERRNLGSHDGVSPLKHIVLPELCPRYLQRPIRQLLRREMPTRPSYYNLSRQGIWREVQDPGVRGCITCLCALRFCEEAVEDTGFESDLARKILQDIKYPDDIDEILSTRIIRLNQLPFVSTRRIKCSKWRMLPPLINFTKDSVEERTCDWDEEEFLQFLYPENVNS